METLATTAGAVSLPIFSPNKAKVAPSRRIFRFSTSPKSLLSRPFFPPMSISFYSPNLDLLFVLFYSYSTDSSDGGNNSDNDLKSDLANSALVPHTLSQDAAMGLVLSAANVRGWTTGSGMEGPTLPEGTDSEAGTAQVSTFPWSLFTKSPRRRMRVAFTCNVCGQRTTRAINPHAYTDGTVFVQCCGCNIFHKLVDNLNLFHEMKCYVNSSFNPNPNDNMSFKYFDSDEENKGDIFPRF